MSKTKKTVMIVIAIVLAGILLLSLPTLFVLIQGVIRGSFESFPREEDIAMKRGIYIVLTAIAFAIDVLAGVILAKIIKRFFCSLSAAR